MKQGNWKIYALWVALAEGVGALAGLLTAPAARAFQSRVNQPPLSPPAALFPIVWGILYALMGVGAARVALEPPSRERSVALNVFMLQLAVNFIWTLVFFLMQGYGLAFGLILLLWVLIVGMIFAFHPLSPLGAWLQVPYLCWVTFAAYLNLGVWLLN